MSEKSNLFNRLTKLFRSGPVIKRNVRNITAQRGSTAVEVFKKAHSDVYNATLSAYGAFDRMCLDLDTRIAVPGKEKFLTMRELMELYPNGEQFVVYAFDHETKSIVPAWAHHPRSSGVRKTVKVTFDDGSFLVCTPDHPCMLRDGTFKDAGDLEIGQSMMPFYRKSFNGKTESKDYSNYLSIYSMSKDSWKGWESEHKMIAEWFNKRKIIKNEEHVHHLDFNPSNNHFDNLLIMNAKDHLALHARLATQMTDEIKQKISVKQKLNWKNDDGSRRKKLIDFNKSQEIREKRRINAIENNVSKSDAVKQKISANAIERYRNEEFRNRASANAKRLHEEGKLKTSDNFINHWKGKKRSEEWKINRTGVNNENYIEITKKNLVFAILEFKERKKVAEALQVSPSTVARRSKEIFGDVSWKQIQEQVSCEYPRNHKVVSVEPWLEIETGDLTVDGYENFATDTIIVHNSRYSDFAEMESTPEICSALDIYAEETVSPDEHGKVLHVYSDNRKVHELLTHLFYDVLNVEFNLVMWVRNLTKYGDFFLFNDINPEFGVINAYPISISEIEREEGYDPNDPAAVRFRWVTQGNQLLENWQISHFRLLGNDAFLPYGSSVLEGARRIWRQLILIEDAMLVYRVIRAPERRVFYIDVGNVPPEEVANYLEQVQTSLKRNQIVDRKTGKVDLRYNPLSVEEDFFLPVRGGESGTKIDTLAGGQNTAAIEDVQYIQNKLFAALKIPKAYIGYDADIGSKATLSQEDIRFSRTIQRIQKTVVSELNKIAQIHLYCHGYDGEDLADFELHLSNPSTVAQMQKLELIRTRFEIAGAAPEGSVNRAWIQKNVLGLTDAEIEEVHTGRITDKKRDLELEGVTADGGDEGGGEGGDVGGGDEGGGLDDLLGGGDEGGGEDLTAGDAKTGDLIVGLPISPSASVQTKRTHNYYGESDEPIDIGSLSILDANAPLKADAAIRSNSFNEERNAFGEEQPKKKVRKKGRRMRTSMPDLLGMVNHERSRDSLKDPFGRTTEPAKVIDESSFTPPRVTFDLVKTLSKMSNVMGIAKKHNALLTESEGEGDPDGKA